MKTATRRVALFELAMLAGERLGTSALREVSQHRIKTFADPTEDRHWIHVDPGPRRDWAVRRNDRARLLDVVAGHGAAGVGGHRQDLSDQLGAGLGPVSGTGAQRGGSGDGGRSGRRRTRQRLMLIAALRTTVVLALLFAVVDVVFVLLGLGALNASTGLATTGGVVGITAAALAWYWSAGGVIASTFGKPVLPNPPLFRR